MTTDVTTAPPEKISTLANLAGLYLTFELAEEVYGIGILSVQEIIGIMSVTHIPRTPPYVRGVVNLRGKVIPIIELRSKFGLQTEDDTERTCIIVVQVETPDAQITMGVIVDCVSEVLDVASGQLEAAPSFGSETNTDFILGMGKVEERVVMLLDVNKILTDSAEVFGTEK